jgi:hsp70-interacting protein
MEAMQENTIDVVKRMKEITLVMKTPEDVLQSQGVTPENIEGTVWSVISIVLTMKHSRVAFFPDMLDELQGHVESIDMANGKKCG